MKNIRRFIIVAFSLILVFSSSITSIAEAAGTMTMPNNTLDINFTSENTWEYIQEIDGEVYKISEEIDLNTDEVTSYISKQNDNGEFILEKTHFTKPIENGIEIVTLEDGVKKVDEVKSETLEVQKNLPVFNDTSTLFTNKELTPWIYSYTLTNSINFTAITFGIVAVALGEFFRLPTTHSFIFGASATIVGAFIPTVYTKKIRYYKNLEGTTILMGIRDHRFVYEYSNFTGLIDSSVEIDCADGGTTCH